MEYVLSNTPPVSPNERRAAQSALDSGAGQPEFRAQATGPYCGNGVCDSGETCATCAPDCKQARPLFCGFSSP